MYASCTSSWKANYEGCQHNALAPLNYKNCAALLPAGDMLQDMRSAWSWTGATGAPQTYDSGFYM